MRKIYKLKKWYTLEEAASRLSLTLDEPVSVNDILWMAIDGYITLSWYTQHVHAQHVAPWVSFPQKIFLKKGKTIELPAIEQLTTLSNIVILDGAYMLDLDMNGLLRDWIISLAKGIEIELMSLDGFHVKGEDGSIWRIMESLTLDEIKQKEKLRNFSNPIQHSDNYIPSNVLPEPAELGIRSCDIESFENLLNDRQRIPSKTEKELSTRECNSLLRLIIGMAVDGYGYDPKAEKSPIPKQLESVLLTRGISISDDTIRKWLRKAAEILPEDITLGE